jgi:hypothetical protein
MLDSGPVFARALHGYDRLQVDNYVAWAESELRAAERINAELMRRLTASEVESLRARQLLAQSPEDRHLARIADRVTELLGLAAQEAAAHAQATAADAEQSREVVTSAYQEAEVVVRRARRLEAQAAARLQEAERRLAEARRTEEETRSAVQDMLAAAAEEQERLESAAEARLAHARWELAELRRRAHQIRRGLTGQLDAALAVLADEPVPGFSFTANLAGPPVAVPHPARDPAEQDRALEA